MSKYIARIIVIRSSGSENIGDRKGKYTSKNEEICGLASKLLKGYKVVDLDLSPNEYAYDRPCIRFFIEPKSSAERNFAVFCRIADRLPEDHLYAVTNCEGLRSLHRTYSGAAASHDSDAECDSYLSIVKVSE